MAQMNSSDSKKSIGNYLIGKDIWNKKVRQ